MVRSGNRRRSLTGDAARPNTIASKLAALNFPTVRWLQNPRSCRLQYGDETLPGGIRIPDSWRFTKLFQCGIGMYFIISFVIHTNTGGSGGIWPTLIIGVFTLFYSTLCGMLLLRPHTRAQLPNYTLALSLLDFVFAGGSLFLCFWMSSYDQYHWHQCHFFWWGRTCKLQRYQNAAMFLNFFTFTITGAVSLHILRRTRSFNRSSSSDLPYSRVPTAPDHDRNKYSGVPSLPRINRNSVSLSGSDSESGRSTPRDSRSLLIPNNSLNVAGTGGDASEPPTRTQSRVGFRAHDSDSENEMELGSLERR